MILSKNEVKIKVVSNTTEEILDVFEMDQASAELAELL